MKKLGLAIAILGLGCASGEVMEPEGTTGYSLGASERTVNETGVVGWQVDNNRAVGRDKDGKVVLDVTMMSKTSNISVLLPERLEVTPGKPIEGRAGQLVAALLADMGAQNPAAPTLGKAAQINCREGCILAILRACTIFSQPDICRDSGWDEYTCCSVAGLACC